MSCKFLRFPYGNNYQTRQAVSICVLNWRNYSLDILRANPQNNDGLMLWQALQPSIY
jgi:hypothetical protein